MSLQTPLKLVVAVLLGASLIGCAGTVAKETSESDKNTTGDYDGEWGVEVLKAASSQQLGNWILSCGDMRRKFTVSVEDGVITVGDKTAFVSNEGKFKMYMPIETKAEATGTSARSMSNGDMKIILRGRLSKSDSAGFLTFGIAEMGYGGCTAKTKFNYLG